MSGPVRALAVAACIGLVSAPAAAAQEIRAALSTDTVTVGDVFTAVVRVRVQERFEAVFPDSLDLPPDLENAGRRYEMVDTVAGAVRDVTVLYPITAWRPGTHELPEIEVQLVSPFDTRTRSATPPAVYVRSVLPVDTAGVEPRPPRDVLGPDRLLWPWLLAVLAALVALLMLALWLTRPRRRDPAGAAPALSPRERVLAELDRIGALGLLEAGEMKVFYSLVTDALRGYLAELNADWSSDLTTSELVVRLERDADADGVAELGRLLLAADMVKFARRRPDAAVALHDLRAARDWVERFRWPPAVETPATPEPVPAEAA